MGEAAFEVVRVGPTLWRTYRDVRLAALIDSPRAFDNTYAAAARRTDADWQAFVGRATLWLALAGDRPLGTIGLYAAPELPPGATYLIGMWVASGARGAGVGDALVAAVVEHGRAHGLLRVILDVATHNAPAIGLYARHGFVRTGRDGVLASDPTVREQEMELLLAR